MPRDESEAVSRDSFLGLSAQVTVGRARRGAPAEARVQDSYGRSHYVMVEPNNPEEVFPAGTRVVLLTRHESIYRVIPDVHLSFDE